MRSRVESRQFIGGSDESPVSIEWICGVNSSKHSDSESKPDSAPKTEKWGVHAWAGTRTASGEVSRTIFSKCFASSPRIGLPSDERLPILDKTVFILEATEKSGARM